MIYTLPKVHKDLKNPPACPIVNSIESVTARLGQHLDTFLQVSVLQTKAYLKDTKNFLQLISEINLSGKQEVFLMTANVSSLNNIIQHDDTLLVLNWALSQRDNMPFEQKVFFSIFDCLITTFGIEIIPICEKELRWAQNSLPVWQTYLWENGRTNPRSLKREKVCSFIKRTSMTYSLFGREMRAPCMNFCLDLIPIMIT